HANGATRILAVQADAADPRGFAEFLAAMSGGTVAEKGDAIAVVLAGAAVRVARNAAARAPLLTGIVFGVADLDATAALFSQGAIRYQRRDGGLHVPAAAGQGAGFVFEEMP